MEFNYIILITIWIIGVALFITFTPKHKKRRLILAFLICQAFTWLSDLLLLNFNLIAFPVREFPSATDMLVTTDYFLYPLLCGFYIIYEPEQRLFVRFIYLSACISTLVFIDIMISKFTDLIEYLNYDWYWTWLLFLCIFAITNIIYQWFFRSKLLLEAEKRITQ
ncbi:CBO0543 family protein [Aquibacillus rhizosphaerae]|uniref:CBO0543 family protein n=1 Tax=Aquibacillus rhizosphaerae TaxID=3051431 RepID=A0ABT7L9H6_9BACI|nr:CBO0543 family protein [Aquibacillus sp. LR5S19]MDL4842520.1 CBO0543 family protein [Aquibacillus sp. LR5S19]